MLDPLATLRRGGRFCLAGWLGGLDPIHDFNPLLQTASGLYLTFFGSFVFGTPGFRLSDVPLQRIAADASTGRLDVKPVSVFRFDEIREAHRVMEANEAGGKFDDSDFSNTVITANCNFHGMQIAGFAVNDLFAAYERQNPGRQK
jgi:NADPH2:quinone reductase